jgi:hypothetical protein
MAFNGSGTFERIYNWVNDKANGYKITASRMDGEFDGIATGLSQCITKDGQTTISANIPMANYKFTGLGNGSSRTDSIALGQVQDGTYTYLGTTSGSADAYTLTPSPSITAYATTQQFTAKINATNTTTTPYLQISAIANPTTTAVIKKLSATKTEIAVEASDLLINGIYDFQRNSANDAWIVLNPEKAFFNATNLTKATSTAQGINYLSNPTNLPSITINSTTPNTTLDISAGVINYDDGSGQFVVSAMSKIIQSTGSWTAGTGQNGLDTGARANSTWYQVFIIRKTSDGTSDILFSTSRTSPTIPSGYTQVAWLGAQRTNASGNIDASYFAKRTPFGQIVSFITGEYSSGPGIIPNDDTIPQIGEGSKFMELLINPLNSSSKLEISSQAFLFNSTGSSWRGIGALFKGSDLNSIATGEGVTSLGSWVINIPLFAIVSSGTTSSITFQFRAGTESASFTYFNGNASRRYGGSFSSFLTIKEYL